MFLVVAVVLCVAHGNRLVLSTNDEGIYLEGARRILEGQKPYVDFWGYMTPGTYWLQALAFRIMGMTIAAGRMPVILDFSLQCAILYWITRMLSSRTAALLTLFLFCGFQTADLSLITAQHRWDSATLALLGVGLCVNGLRSGRPVWFVSSGIALAFGVLCTPSLVLVAGVTVLYLASDRDRRKSAALCAAGGLSVACATCIFLSAQGMLGPLLQEMRGLTQGYGEANTVPFGAVIGGYSALFEDAAGFELVVRALLALIVALPAVLPVLSVAGWGAADLAGRIPRENRRIIVYLLLCVAGFAASTYPRPDVMHLAWVAALAYAMSGALLAGLLPLKIAKSIGWTFVIFSAVLGWHTISLLLKEKVMATPVGLARVPADDEPDVRSVLQRVRPGSKLFVYPNKALLYFVTQTKNPTRVPFTMPGMRPLAAEALRTLAQNPPDWVLYQEISPEEYVRIFPALRGADLHEADLESWIKHNYYTVQGCSISGYALMRRSN